MFGSVQSGTGERFCSVCVYVFVAGAGLAIPVRRGGSYIGRDRLAVRFSHAPAERLPSPAGREGGCRVASGDLGGQAGEM